MSTATALAPEPVSHGTGSGRRRAPTDPVSARRRRLFWPFLAPTLILYTAILLGPLLYTAYLSLYRWRGIGPRTFRGLGNYRQLLGDPAFQSSFVNTFVITIGVGLVVFVLSFALTLVLRDMRGRRFTRSILFLPNIVAPIVLSILWGFIFRSDGLVNSALARIGVTGPNWLGSANQFWMICVALVWIYTGFYVTILMAAVDNIPAYYYEDALLAGANAFQRLWHVTLPLSWDVISAAALLWTISSIKIFEFIYAFAGASGYLPPVNTWNSALFVYGQTFGGRTAVYQFGYASAAALAMLIPVGLLVLILLRLGRRESVQT